MSKYKCNCGGKLELIEEVLYRVIKKVSEVNGKLSKKSNISPEVVGGGASWLQCVVCDKEYEYAPLGNNRFCKGEERI